MKQRPIFTRGLNEYESRWRLLAFGVPHIHWRRIQIQMEELQSLEINNRQVCTVCMMASRLIARGSRLMKTSRLLAYQESTSVAQQKVHTSQ